MALKFRPVHVALYAMLIFLPACVKACEPFCTDDNDDVETSNKGGGDLGKSPLEKPGDSSTKPKVKPYPPSAARARAARTAGRAVKLPVDKRIAMSGKPGFPFSRIRFDRVDTGPFDARATVAVDPLDPGLTATTRGYVQMNLGDGSHFKSLEARWRPQSRGFQVEAFDESTELGSLLVPNASEVDLRIEQTDMGLNTYVRPTPADHSEEDGWLPVSTATPVNIETPFRFLFGADGLDDKGTVYFAFMTIRGDRIGGAAERPIMNEIGITIVVPDRTAIAELAAPAPNLTVVSMALQLVEKGSTDAQASIASELAAATFQATTQAKKAQKVLEKVRKLALAAQKVADAGDLKKVAKLQKATKAVFENAVVAMANLGGFKFNSYKQIPLAFVYPQ